MSPQLPLQLGFAAPRDFADFEPEGAAAVGLVRAAAQNDRERLFLSGPPGSGKSHLLQAACSAAAQAGRGFAYLPLATLREAGTDALAAQPPVSLLCIDGLDAAAGDAAAEWALFALHNRQSDAGGSLLYAARAGADALPIALADLRSRLQHCTRVLLEPLDEPARRAWLRRRGAERGLQLEEPVIEYLFRQVGRDLGTLAALLDRIDRDSLAAQRRVTVPFLREMLARERS
jgi:DnaA-homolog protein